MGRLRHRTGLVYDFHRFRWEMGVFMNSTFVTRLRGGISAVSLAVLVSASGVLGTLAGLSPAYAQTALTADQASSIQTSLTASIQAAGNNPTAVEAAISQALQTAISTYGAG